MKPETWNDILAAMISVRDAHGWREDGAAPQSSPMPPSLHAPRKPVTKKKARPAVAKSSKKPSPKSKKTARRASARPSFKKKLLRAKSQKKRASKPKAAGRKKSRKK
jgi:hypothetical protein